MAREFDARSDSRIHPQTTSMLAGFDIGVIRPLGDSRLRRVLHAQWRRASYRFRWVCTDRDRAPCASPMPTNRRGILSPMVPQEIAASSGRLPPSKPRISWRAAEFLSAVLSATCPKSHPSTRETTLGLNSPGCVISRSPVRSRCVAPIFDFACLAPLPRAGPRNRSTVPPAPVPFPSTRRKSPSRSIRPVLT